MAQSLTKLLQDPRLVGKEPLLSQGQLKSRRLQPEKTHLGSFPSLLQPVLGCWEEGPG